MSGWTKGPWLAAAKPSSIVGWPVVAPHATGRSVCSVTVHDEAKANADLIAAAPDLAEALAETLAIARRNESGAYIDRAEAALSKAKGGRP